MKDALARGNYPVPVPYIGDGVEKIVVMSVAMRKNIGRSNSSFEFPRNRRKFVKLSCR